MYQKSHNCPAKPLQYNQSLKWSLLEVKKGWATPKLVSFRGLIQNFRRASPPLSYGTPPGTRPFRNHCLKSLLTIYFPFVIFCTSNYPTNFSLVSRQKNLLGGEWTPKKTRWHGGNSTRVFQRQIAGAHQCRSLEGTNRHLQSSPYHNFFMGPGARFSKVPVIYGPINLSEPLSGRKLRFSKHPYTFTVLTGPLENDRPSDSMRSCWRLGFASSNYTCKKKAVILLNKI